MNYRAFSLFRFLRKRSVRDSNLPVNLLISKHLQIHFCNSPKSATVQYYRFALIFFRQAAQN